MVAAIDPGVSAAAVWQAQLALATQFLNYKFSSPQGELLERCLAGLASLGVPDWSVMAAISALLGERKWLDEFAAYSQERAAPGPPPPVPVATTAAAPPAVAEPPAFAVQAPPPSDAILVQFPMHKDVYEAAVEVLAAGKRLEGIPLGQVIFTWDAPTRDGGNACLELVHGDDGPALIGHVLDAAGRLVGASVPYYALDACVLVPGPRGGYALQAVPTPF